jgi:hypothetical protein
LPSGKVFAFLYLLAKLGADIRTRIRSRVIRIRVAETCIRAVIRITAE